MITDYEVVYGMYPKLEGIAGVDTCCWR